MDLIKCLNIMQIDKNDFINYDVFKLKKKYHILALKKHPDKGGNDDDFKELNMSYNTLNEVLLHKIDTNNINDNNIKNYIELFKFLLNREDINEYIYIKGKEFIQHITKEFKIHYENNIKSNITIELHPTLNDMLINNIYKYNYYDTFFLVPLWHNEIHFEYNNKNIIFICNPILPVNYYIDKNNIIHINISRTIQEIITKSTIDINFNNKILSIDISKLYIKESQIYIFQKKGLSEINNTDIYNVSVKMDVIIHINIIF